MKKLPKDMNSYEVYKWLHQCMLELSYDDAQTQSDYFADIIKSMSVTASAMDIPDKEKKRIEDENTWTP